MAAFFITVLFLCCLLGSFVHVLSKEKVWGVGVDEDGNQQKVRQDSPGFGASSFEELQKQAEKRNQMGGAFDFEGLGDLMQGMDLGDLDGLAKMMEGMDLESLGSLMEDSKGYMEQLMDTPEVQQLLNDPDLLMAQLKDNPMFADNEELLAIGEWGQGLADVMKGLGDQDPNELMKLYGELMKDLDPSALEELQGLLTDETKLTEAAQQMGDVFKEMQDAFKDPAKIVEMQEALLNDPDLKNSPFFNTPEMKELLENPVKLAEYMQETLGGAQDWLNQAEAAA
mmetsp:Transcript_19012/g.23965  ORF Transcript_19012/g.23965 Transcript_19012/m.23965 type:complete len:283 (+) Transcript_19012:86-934(+)